MSLLRQRLIEDLTIRNYSPRTIEVYVDRVAKFAQYIGESPEKLGPAEIREFQLYLVEKKKSSWAEFNQTVCALRFFYKVCLGKSWMIEQTSSRYLSSPSARIRYCPPTPLHRASDMLQYPGQLLPRSIQSQ